MTHNDMLSGALAARAVSNAQLGFWFVMAAPPGLEVLPRMNNRRHDCALIFKPTDQAVPMDQAFPDTRVCELRHYAPEVRVFRNRLGVPTRFETTAFAYHGESRSM
jgi:hypothetical protein